jgi:Ca2+-transporting ATPase
MASRSNSALEARDAYARAADSVLAQLSVDPARGLSQAEVDRRIAQHGQNSLAVSEGVRWPVLFARQFADVLIAILAVAAVLSLLIGETLDAAVIAAILIFNALLGFAQEWRAARAIAALKRMVSPGCNALRDGVAQAVGAASLVPGDIVLLRTGDRVPADLRLLESRELRIDESSLTGESNPVSKQAPPVPEHTPLAERRSAAWMGTAICHGSGTGVVIATGMHTEIGRIAEITKAVPDERTPLQKKLNRLGRQLGVVAVAVSTFVAVAGWWIGKPALEMFMTGVSLAVAVVPEGLPAVVTITLALGIRAMIRRRALLRTLSAAETLGSATVICTDKTGTLTQNEMTLREVWLRSGSWSATGTGYDPEGTFEINSPATGDQQAADLDALLTTGLLCNHAELAHEGDRWAAIGEPTEAALLTAARKSQADKPADCEPVREFPFSSARKRMTVLVQGADGTIAHVKGAPEIILERCTRVFDAGVERELTAEDRSLAIEAYQRFARQGLRTLALARRSLSPELADDPDVVECELSLLGVVGILDPPRPEVAGAIALAQDAGIRVLMITGDAAATALTIADRIGLRAQSAMSGLELDTLDDVALRAALDEEVVVARVTPEHKLRIVSLLQDTGNIVAMTGDGVNDAPALKKADVGIAMGIRGTEVAKGASDMVLIDDNFASIVGAVEEGRRQYDNIQKFVRYLLSSNTGEVTAILINILLGGPLILLPVQILWMNLVTDGVTSVALGLEPVEPGIMERAARDQREPILDRRSILSILGLGGYIGIATLLLFQYYLEADDPNALARAQTLAFTGIIVMEKVNVFNFRALRAPLSAVGWWSNRWVTLAVASTLGLQLAAVYVPFMQRALHTVPLNAFDWVVMLAVAVPLLVVSETVKRRGWRHRTAARATAN